ncbi:MAG: hypothetical protein J6X49_15245, partial [Victivallales bacterium]|nr:hypothetical protein [Victivallales bacterium]
FLLPNRLIISRLTSCRPSSPRVSRLTSLVSRPSPKAILIAFAHPTGGRNGVAIIWFDMRRET